MLMFQYLSIHALSNIDKGSLEQSEFAPRLSVYFYFQVFQVLRFVKTEIMLRQRKTSTESKPAFKHDQNSPTVNLSPLADEH